MLIPTEAVGESFFYLSDVLKIQHFLKISTQKSLTRARKIEKARLCRALTEIEVNHFA